MTAKEAREFRESGETQKTEPVRSGGGIVTVADGIEKWLEVCEKEGRDGRDPVTDFTLKGYKYRAKIVKSYHWKKSLQELTAPDIIEFRSWLLTNHPRSMAHFVLSSFHSMILEMVFRGVLLHDVAARVSIRERSRYEEPVTIPSEQEVLDLLAPNDIDDEKYISIPDKRELDLGKPLVLDFAREFLPEDYDEVRHIFSRRGAYRRYKDLLVRRGALERWYDFSNKAEEAALREWCAENGIDLSGT